MNIPAKLQNCEQIYANMWNKINQFTADGNKMEQNQLLQPLTGSCFVLTVTTAAVTLISVATRKTGTNRLEEKVGRDE